MIDSVLSAIFRYFDEVDREKIYSVFYILNLIMVIVWLYKGHLFVGMFVLFVSTMIYFLGLCQFRKIPFICDKLDSFFRVFI
ncbi:MAG: hypothetical protein DSY46_02955 [Hydrogenimonas sp.]|nr:MAG: hypothetical protein DSY46_02955 [Hydrogenimonas sp.]